MGPDETFDVTYPEGTNGPRPTIVWIHGGGWIGGSTNGIANYLQVLAGHGYTTVAVEYSRGFGGTYPKPVEQVNAALGYLVRHAADLHIDPATIILAGDSAGAQIAGQVALTTTDQLYASAVGIHPELRRGQLKAMLLLSGAYDLDAVDYRGDYAWFLKTVLWAYSGVENFLEDDRFQLMSLTPMSPPPSRRASSPAAMAIHSNRRPSRSRRNSMTSGFGSIRFSSQTTPQRLRMNTSSISTVPLGRKR